MQSRTWDEDRERLGKPQLATHLVWDSPDEDLSKNCQKRVKPLSFAHLCGSHDGAEGTDPLSQVARKGIKIRAGVSTGNHQDGRKSRRINAESRKKPSPRVNGIAPKEAAIQASGSTRAMSVKVIM